MTRTLLRRLVIALVFGVLVYAGFALYADLSELSKNLGQFAWEWLPAVIALVLLNYVLRFARWHYYLKVLDLPVEARPSAAIFLAGFVMSVTPGKLGELLKAVLLRDRCGAPVARTAPIVIAERLTDFIGIVLICSFGSFTFDYGAVVLLVCGALCVVAIVLASSRPLAHTFIELTRKLPGVRRLSDKFHEMYESMAELVRPGPLLFASALSVVAWLGECVAFWVVCYAMGAAAAGVDFSTALFIYGFATIFGAVTMLPGGLGATEGSMTGLLLLLGKVAQAPAVAITLFARVCTLWFGVAIGLVALSRLRAPAEAEAAPAEPARAAKER